MSTMAILFGVFVLFVVFVAWVNLDDSQAVNTTWADRLCRYPAEAAFSMIGPAIVPVAAIGLLVLAWVVWVVYADRSSPI
jgi:hypothetical protein